VPPLDLHPGDATGGEEYQLQHCYKLQFPRDVIQNLCHKQNIFVSFYSRLR